MAKVVVKKKPGIRSFSGGGGSSVETSPLRPYQVEKLAPCMDKCPNQTNIRGMLTAITLAEKQGRTMEESFRLAFNVLAEKNPFPASCARVCPHPCETGCNRQHKESPVGINNLERFIGDWALEQTIAFPAPAQRHGEKIAIIGSGPAGMSCAYQLALLGYPVTVFEAFPKTGGMLRYGIPEYRLPRNVLDAEMQRILDLGVELKPNTVVGRDIPYHDLQKEYKAIFVGIGAHQGKKLGLPGEDVPNLWTGTGFLNKVNSKVPVEVGDHVVVVGGGDTAIDAARVSRRLGAKVTILYRRTRTEMPAIEEEIVGAEQENVELVFLAAPLEIIQKDGRAVGMVCQRMELGEPDSSGRRRPVPIPGDTFELFCSTIIAAISQEPDFTGFDDLHEGRDWIKADEHGHTRVPSVYAGGDDLDLGLVTIAIYQGRKAAEAIHCDLRGLPFPDEKKLKIQPHDRLLLTYFEQKIRAEAGHLDPEVRLAQPDAEITSTLSQEQAVAEAFRCMSCGSCFECGQCWSFCQDGAIKKPVIKGQPYTFKLEICNGCKKCAEQCPCGVIEML
ncbi:MAG: FAD-dependent oxidoreductase [Candidatus Zixiibacteriota bacterium]|nr:MAG: FAD-dependent oxidoreductase [candidate division Zixibacteria bacterium]